MILLNEEDFEILIQETPDYDGVSVVLGTLEHVFEPGINYLYLLLKLIIVV